MNNNKKDLVNNNLLLTINSPAPIKFHMGTGVYGSYDNIILKANNNDGWKKQPSNVPLLPKNAKFYVPQGTPLPLKDEEIYTTLPKDSMFYLQYNQASPICSSTYSTDRGQVCTTPYQRKYIGQLRGNNKNFYDDGF
jgi:hypothetical protein